MTYPRISSRRGHRRGSVDLRGRGEHSAKWTVEIGRWPVADFGRTRSTEVVRSWGSARIQVSRSELSLLWMPLELHESEEKEGGTQTREQWSPLLVRGSLINEPREERDCVSR